MIELATNSNPSAHHPPESYTEALMIVDLVQLNLLHRTIFISDITSSNLIEIKFINYKCFHIKSCRLIWAASRGMVGGVRAKD